ncbi:MAG: transglutaminase N-terminal domain-containing protein [Desulfobacteraceae bacterium]|jgi:hypothetical protein|nr:transglutaminase N-terminal domain-containing protein [Desulfobacteraceae bacterium]
MQRYKILHRTYYNFSGVVRLGPHDLCLRPREDYELPIESLALKIAPPATLLWHWDVRKEIHVMVFLRRMLLCGRWNVMLKNLKRDSVEGPDE